MFVFFKKRLVLWGVFSVFISALILGFCVILSNYFFPCPIPKDKLPHIREDKFFQIIPTYQKKTYQPIPKIIHYIWVGPNPEPETFKPILASWKKYAPDYKIMKWDESNCGIDDNEYVREAYRQKNYSHVSDYCRFKALYEYGGLYLDVDHELKEGALDVLKNTDCFLVYETKKGLSSSFVAVAKNHLLMKSILDNLMDVPFDWDLIGPTMLTWHVNHFFGYEFDGKLFKSKELTIYPFNFYAADLGGGENKAIHYYDASWVNTDKSWYHEFISWFLRDLAISVKFKGKDTQHIVLKEGSEAYIYETKQRVVVLYQGKNDLYLWVEGLKKFLFKDGVFVEQ